MLVAEDLLLLLTDDETLDRSLGERREHRRRVRLASRALRANPADAPGPG
jgi:hypothetical protein